MGVKQDQQSLESDKDATRVLTLSRNLRDTANEVVRAYDALDVEALERDELDAVDLRFATPAGLERADELVHQLAIVDDELRAKLNQPLRLFFTPLRKYVEALNGSIQKLVSEQPQDAALVALARKLEVLQQQAEGLEKDFKEGRDRLIDHLRSSDFSQCKSSWRALDSKLIELEGLRSTAYDIANTLQPKLQPGGAYPAASRSPITPVRIGTKDERRGTLTVPLKLFLGQTVTGLCRRLAQINTDIAELPVDVDLWGRAEIYCDLFTHRDLESVRLPLDDTSVSPRYLPAAQKQLESFRDALKQFLVLVLKREEKVPRTTSKRRSTGNRKANHIKGVKRKRKTRNSTPDAKQISAGSRAEETESPSVSVAAKLPQSQATQPEPSFQVIIKSATHLIANGIQVARLPARRLLLALAVMKGKSASNQFTFKTKALRGLLGNSFTRKAWYAHKQVLKQVLPELKIDGGSAEYTIYGLCFTFKCDRQDCERHLKSEISKESESPAAASSG